MNGPENILAAGFLTAAARYPSHPALRVNNTEYSFAALRAMAVSVAGRVTRDPSEPVVGVYATDSPWTYAALLGVVMAGGCYVPLSSGLPRARLDEIIATCGIKLVVSPSPVDLTVDQIVVPSLSDEKTVRHFEQPLAYILFTSGSTGKQKGVPVSYAQLDGFFAHFDAHFDFSPDDRFLQPFDLAFDMSVFAMFLAWRAGACVCTVPMGGSRPLNIFAAIRDHRITVAPMVPTVLSYAERYYDELNLSHLRYCFFAGDRLSAQQAAAFQKKCAGTHIYNCYGPTEAAIVCTQHRFDPAHDLHGDVPIGKVFAGLHYLLADENLSKHDSSGELCLSGRQVITQYFGSTDKDRFFTFDGMRYYRTGDRCALNTKGELEFLGRIDDQVKIGGHRVEPAEVEHAITHATGRRAAVIAVGESSGKILVAFVEGEFEVDTTLQSLSETLPVYMQPREIIPVNALPTGANEKIDRTQLIRMYHERNNR